MTREEQLTFCKQCTNRKLDPQQGLVCSITNEKPIFSVECPDFDLDESVKNAPISTIPLEQSELTTHLPVETIEKLRLDQNLPMAVVVGVIVGLVGAVLWGVITVAMNYQIGYMALAIGAAVGFAMRFAGKGIDQIFGVLAGIIALISCFFGNFLSIIGFIANSEGSDYIETLLSFDYAYFVPLMTETFGFMDIVFYGIAAYEGYKFSFRQVSNEDIAGL